MINQAFYRENYGPPMICAKQFQGEWLTWFVLEGRWRNVLGSFHLDTFYTLYDFNEMVGYLPAAMQSLYFVTDALQMAERDFPALGWYDLPSRYGGRRNVVQYCKMKGYSAASATPMIKPLKL